MNLTPLDIRKQEFRKALRGFDPDEVQAFLDMVGAEYERLLEKNKQLEHRLIELETKLKDYRESEKNLRETLLNVQEVKKQSEESSRKQADLIIKESELKALEIIEMARKQARQMRDEVSILKTQKESFINRLRQILISQIELISVLEIDDALPEEAFTFLDNVKTRKKLAINSHSVSENTEEIEELEEITEIEFAEEPEDSKSLKKIKKDSKNVKNSDSVKDQEQEIETESKKDIAAEDTTEDTDMHAKVDDDINEFFKKEIQIDELMKDIQKKNKK
jgi:cell division initiation protein